jgi:hypothetical protein
MIEPRRKAKLDTERKKGTGTQRENREKRGKEQ